MIRHCRKLMDALKEQRDSNSSLCDLTLITVDSEEVRCHKSVLSANSDYFKAMLTSSFVEASKNTLDVPFNSDHLTDILNLFYDGAIELRMDNCLEFLETSDMLLADELKSECVEYVVENFAEILSCKQTLYRDSSTLRHLLPLLREQPSLNLKQILNSLLRWAKYDIPERIYCFLDFQQVITEKLSDEETVFPLKPEEFVDDAEVFVNFQNRDQTLPRLLKFDGIQWEKCDWPSSRELPRNCEHFCIVDYGESLLYCRSHGEPITLIRRNEAEVIVEQTTGSLISFLKSSNRIFLLKMSRTGDRVMIYDRENAVFHALELPANFKIVRLGDTRMAENEETNEIFMTATIRSDESTLQEGVFCLTLNATRAWIVESIRIVVNNSCPEVIPAFYAGAPVVLLPEEGRAVVYTKNGDGWREKLSFPIIELDGNKNYVVIYVYTSRDELFLVVAQDGDVRVVRYAGHQSCGEDVTELTRFPAARLVMELGVIFCDDI